MHVAQDIPVIIITKIFIHLANCLMTSAATIFCLPDIHNDTISILTSRCFSILHHNLLLMF